MFDTYITPRPRTEYVTRRVEVTENRAPTDESVKLLVEMEKAADAKRTTAMQMPGNTFHGVVEHWFNGPDHTEHARCVFDLNGKRCVAKAWQRADGDKQALVKALFEDVQRVIAAEILQEALRGVRF